MSTSHSSTKLRKPHDTKSLQSTQQIVGGCCRPISVNM